MLSFEQLPMREKMYLIDAFGLPEREERLLVMRYVDGFSYARIAAEMSMSSKSVGNSLTRARKHMVDVARDCYELADDRTKSLIDVLGWAELDWPTLDSRRKKISPRPKPGAE